MPISTFAIPRTERVTYGEGALDHLGALVDAVGGTRVLTVLSGSLAGTPAQEQLERALGPRSAALYTRTRQHVPRASVLEAAATARTENVDCVVSFGGGTPIDCAKAITLCLAEGIERPEQFEDYRVRFTYPDRYEVPPVNGELIPHIAIPTTLSGGEHTALFGVTDERTHLKGAFVDPGFAPRAVVLDPAATRATPGWLWAASGLRAIDHAVEGLLSARRMPFADALAQEALSLLGANLARSAADPADSSARLNCLLGTWLSIFALPNVGSGLSHGIGHQLAAEYDLIHGVTSAIMLPLVMEFQAEATGPQQRRVAEALGRATGRLDDAAAARDAVAAIRALIAELAVPQTISAAGGKDAGALSALADRVMQDSAVAASPRPVGREDILILLRKAWA